MSWICPSTLQGHPLYIQEQWRSHRTSSFRHQWGCGTAWSHWLGLRQQAYIFTRRIFNEEILMERKVDGQTSCWSCTYKAAKSVCFSENPNCTSAFTAMEWFQLYIQPFFRVWSGKRKLWYEIWTSTHPGTLLLLLILDRKVSMAYHNALFQLKQSIPVKCYNATISTYWVCLNC